jgi:serine/threonine-protein kinase
VTVEEHFSRALSAHYVIERELSGGGMSRVFLGEETALRRKIVIKVLPSETAGQWSVERFRREITLAAQLQHPHIVPLLAAGDVDGLPYFTMPFVRGESLRERLARHGEMPVPDAVRILREVATALAYAHGEGIVHRDIKPENILLSGDVASVTDFGVAKALSDSAQGQSTLTSLGVALGTPAYMSPEQATANPMVDQRADIYAWGVLAYEMLTGAAPFAGRSLQAQLAAHIVEVPESLSRRRSVVPVALSELVMQCLAKSPADRPQRALDLVHAIDALVTPTAGTAPALAAVPSRQLPRRLVQGVVAGFAVTMAVVAWMVMSAPVADARTVAVLPFDNIGGDTANAYFSEGMADELITALGHVAGLRVAGRTSSFSARVRQSEPQEIGRVLNVGSYVGGSVQRSGGRIKVVAHLISTKDGIALWSQTFERPLTDVFRVQDEIARAIAAELLVTLTPAPAAPTADSRVASNLEAYRMFLKGRQLWTRRGHQNLLSAIQHFKQALALDSSFARAHAGLALVYVILPGYALEYLPVQDSIWALALDHAHRALAADPGDSDARVALAFTKAFQWKWESAEQEFRQVLLHDPSNTTAHVWFGMTLIAQDRIEEAIEQLERAVQLDPLSQVAAWQLAMAQLVGQRYEDANATNMRMLQIDTLAGRAYGNAAFTSLMVGKFDEAVRLGRRGSRLMIDDTLGAIYHQALGLALQGQREAARRHLALLRTMPEGTWGPSDWMLLEALVGSSDSVFKYLNDAADIRGHGLVDNIPVCHPLMQNLWNDPRFPEFTNRMGIPMCTKSGAPRRTPAGGAGVR